MSIYCTQLHMFKVEHTRHFEKLWQMCNEENKALDSETFININCFPIEVTYKITVNS